MTIDDIATEAATDYLRRPELVPMASKLATRAYLLICAKVPFDELQSQTNFTTTKAVGSYSLAELPLNGIISVKLTQGSITRRLRRSHVRLYDAFAVSREGVPSTYARFGNNIELRPVPSSSMRIDLRYWASPPISEPFPGHTELFWPRPWDELLLWETMYRLYVATEQHEKAMLLWGGGLQPPIRLPFGQKVRVKELGILPQLWNDLLRTISMREGVDEDFSISPIYRPYTD